MKHQIVSRWDSAKVLFECDVPDSMETGLRTRYALEKATEARAYLTDANLAGANLERASLAEAKWRDIIINKPPIQLFGLHWRVTILDAYMQIGCEMHSLAEWASFDDARICEMDGRNALRFWRAHRDALLALAKSAERSFDPVVAVDDEPQPAAAES